MNQLSLRNNRLKSRTAGKSPIISEEFDEYTPIQLRKPKDVSLYPVGLANTRISTDYAQKSPGSLIH
jgi:hypothetical protein